MGKIRGIKPTTWTDDKFVSLSPLARLLFMGMWTEACDNGHVEDNPVQLKIRLLPMDACSITELVNELLESGLVIRGEGWLKVVNLVEHQKVPDRRFLTLCTHCAHDESARYTEDDKIRPAGKPAPKATHTAGKASPVKGHTAGSATPDRTATAGTRRAHGEKPASGPAPLASDVDGDGEVEGEGEEPVVTSGGELSSGRGSGGRPDPSSAPPGGPEPDQDDRPRPEIVELCDYLAERVRTNGHTANVGKRWHRACRLLIDVDGHTPDQVRKAIDWATTHPFWSTNIRSMQTLRDKYSILRAQATQPRNGSRRQQDTDDIFANSAARMGITQPLSITGGPTP